MRQRGSCVLGSLIWKYLSGKKDRAGDSGGKREEEMLLHPLPDKQKLRAFTGVEWGSGGERTLEERGGREGGR